MRFDWKSLDLVVIDWVVVALAFLVAFALMESFYYRSGLSLRSLGSIFAIALLAFMLFVREKVSVSRLKPKYQK